MKNLIQQKNKYLLIINMINNFVVIVNLNISSYKKPSIIKYL
jgi:hypothetical protein